MSKLKYLFLIMVSVLAFACDGEDGAQGPIGPAGPQGQQGPAGQDGTNGTDGQDGVNGTDGADGQDGNANVIASDWLTLPASFTTPNIFFAVANFTDPNITPATVSSSAVLAYGRDTGNGEVRSIPFVLLNESYTFSLIPDTNEISFLAASTDSTQETFDLFDEVRYVIIPQGSASASRGETLKNLKDSGIDVSNYYHVMDYLGFDY